jgi:endonuclease G
MSWLRRGTTLVVLLGTLAASGGSPAVRAGEGSPPVHVRWGLPSPATTDKKNKNDFLMVKEYFVLSYNNSTGTPNWVSWRLTKDEIGNAPRPRLFAVDKDLPQGFLRVKHQDYTGSGFDRGHMCPHSDRAKDKDMSSVTFILTNVIPQAPNVNQGLWDDLEEYCRFLVQEKGKVLYIVAGPRGKGGKGRFGFKAVLPKNSKVVVPSHCWKVILVVDADADKRGEVGKDPRIIAVDMPNSNDTDQDWTRHRCPLQEVEQLTGYRFFTKAIEQVKQADADLAQSLQEDRDDETIPRLPRAHPRPGRSPD